MFVPKTAQVPIQQGMYVNGVMHQVWIDFFERLASLRSDSDLIDIIELAQKAAELPSQAVQGQQGFDIANLKNQLHPIPIQIPQTEEIPPIQAVFLCPEQSISLAPVPSGDIIHD